MTTLLAPEDLTDDAFLGEGLHILQPKAGYRAGIDAVLLAATVHAPGRARILDAGAGVGVVGLCAAQRLKQADVQLVEREAALCDLARQNIRRNGLGERVSVIAADVTLKASALEGLDLQEETADVVLANPPFHVVGEGTQAHSPLKAASHAMLADHLENWVRFATRMTRPGGSFTLIHKADALASILAAMAQRFGSVKIKPIHPRAGESAIRVLVQGTKGSKAPLELRPPLVLHADGKSFTPEVDAILRYGEPLTI